MIRTGIADDHTLFADGLRNALDLIPDIDVAWIAGDVPELLDHFEDQPIDVAILDFEMPGGGAVAALEHLAGAASCLVVTMHASGQTEKVALEAGAAAVFSKAVPLDELARAIRAVTAGSSIPTLDDPERPAVLDGFGQPRLDPGAASLTEREREILTLLAKGVSSTEELAEQLYISQKTVKNHLASIFTKLAVSDRTQAAVEAIRLGLGRPK